MWFLLSFLTAIFRSLNDIFSKIYLKDRDIFTFGLSMRLWASILLVPIVLLKGIESPENDFFFYLLLSGILNSFVTVLYFNSLKKAQISLAMPLLTLTPVFMLFTSPFITGEFPSSKGIFGIILIVFGAYTINLDKKRSSFLTPFISIIKDSGTRSMFFVSVLWSFAAPIDKLGIISSSPLLWGTSVNVFMVFSIFIYIKLSGKKIDIKAFRLPLPGIFAGLTILTQMKALQMAIVPYVISIKRTSIIFSVLAGILLFKEDRGVYRLLSSIIMVVGVVIIFLFA